MIDRYGKSLRPNSEIRIEDASMVSKEESRHANHNQQKVRRKSLPNISKKTAVKPHRKISTMSFNQMLGGLEKARKVSKVKAALGTILPLQHDSWDGMFVAQVNFVRFGLGSNSAPY